MTQTQIVSSPAHTTNNFHPDVQRIIGPAVAAPIGVGQGTAMSPYRFAMNGRKKTHSNTSNPPKQMDDNKRQERTSHSDSDSFTENTSALTVSSLYDEKVERLQLEHDLVSLDSSQMEDMEDWDIEINYNSLNYLTVPDNSAPLNDNSVNFTQPIAHCPNSDYLSTNQRFPSSISHNIHNVIHDSDCSESNGL